MKFSYGLPVVLVGAAATVMLAQPYMTAALTPNQVYEIARAITVLIDGQFPGSGVIVAQEGNTYTVLTAKHVVATEDNYEVVTPDNKRNPVSYTTVKKLPEGDLAVFLFTSNETYRVASLGNSDLAAVGTAVYVSGFPKPGIEIKTPLLQFTNGLISGRSDLRDGYALIYTNLTRAGMSGGPVLDENGKLVGIHGRAESETLASDESGISVNSKVGFNLGIPINTFLSWAPQIGLNLNSPETLTTPPPVPGSSISGPPALLWAYQTNKTSIDECLEKAYITMHADSFKNITSNREGVFVSGIADSYAVDISCHSEYSTIIVAGPDKNTAKLWLDRFWKAMAPERVNLPPRPATAPASTETAPPALRWSFGTNTMSDDDCVSKAYSIMQQEGLNPTLNREAQYVSGLADKYAADISCKSEYWMVVVTGADKGTAGEWRDKLRDAMER